MILNWKQVPMKTMPFPHTCKSKNKIETCNDDDFIQKKGGNKAPANIESSGDEFITEYKGAEVVVTSMLLENYTYKFLEMIIQDHITVNLN